MPAPLHPERWLPKFNPDYGLPAEENLHNYMLAINLNEVDEEDVVVRLFPYTLTGSTRSWYFSLPTNSILIKPLQIKLILVGVPFPYQDN